MPSGAGPRVDVGVVTWNTRDLTVQALRRVLESETSCELRLLVHDNASTDGTPEAIRDAVPESVLEAGSENVGFAAATNRLLARSDAPWFLALNSDAWPEPGAIARLVEGAQAHPRTAAVAPRLLRPDGTLEHSTYPFPSLRVAATCAVGGYTRTSARRDRARASLLEGAWLHDEPRVVDWAVGAALLMARPAVEGIGGFDERLFMYAEDLDWCWRAREQGWVVRFEPTAVFRHVGNASGSQAYGRARARAHVHNAYRVSAQRRSLASLVALRALNAAGAGRLAVAALLARDVGRARHWLDHLAAHVTPCPRRDPGPPATASTR